MNSHHALTFVIKEASQHLLLQNYLKRELAISSCILRLFLTHPRKDRAKREVCDLFSSAVKMYDLLLGTTYIYCLDLEIVKFFQNTLFWIHGRLDSYFA